MKFFIKLSQNWEESLKDLNNYYFNPYPTAHLRAQQSFPALQSWNMIRQCDKTVRKCTTNILGKGNRHPASQRAPPEKPGWHRLVGLPAVFRDLHQSRALGPHLYFSSKCGSSQGFCALLLVWFFLTEEPVQNHVAGSCCPRLTWHSHLLLPGRFASPGPAAGAARMGLEPSTAPALLHLQHPMGILPLHSPASSHSNSPSCAGLIHRRKPFLMRSDILRNSLES